MHGKQWTTAEEKTLTDLRAQGYTLKYIGYKLGRSRSSVYTHFVEMQKRANTYNPTPYHLWSQSELDYIKERWLAGDSCTKIGEKIGVSQFAVYSQLRKLREQNGIEDIKREPARRENGQTQK